LSILQISLVIYGVRGATLSYAYNDNIFILICVGIICRQIVLDRVPAAVVSSRPRLSRRRGDWQVAAEAPLGNPTEIQPSDAPPRA